MLLIIYIIDLFLGQFSVAVQGTLMAYAVDIDLHCGNAKYGPPDLHEGLDKMEPDDSLPDYSNFSPEEKQQILDHDKKEYEHKLPPKSVQYYSPQQPDQSSYTQPSYMPL